MEELIFFAVIIFFSIIESIARKRKQRPGGPVEAPTEWRPDRVERQWDPSTRYEPGPPNYDVDPSYDDHEAEEAAGSQETLPRYEAPYGTTERVETRAGSEGMIPADIWEEVAGLARGRMRQLETRPEPSMPTPTPPVPRPAPARDSWGKRVARVGQEHRVHLAHAEYGTDPSSRARSQQDDLDPLARSLSAEVRAVRRDLRIGGRSALRRAVILQEVLGPPASMQPEPLPE